MTIALGILASDGLVVAADTHESYGYWKVTQGKLRGSLLHAESGADTLFLTGAGDSHSLDAVMRRLQKVFSETPGQDSDQRHAAFDKALRQFYRDYILPFARYPENERPGFELLLGYCIQGRIGLWTSQRNALDVRDPVAAVGVGATLAHTLFNRFYKIPSINVRSAVLLASYVMFHVKDSFEGCGRDTDIFAVALSGNDNRSVSFIPRKKTEQFESAVKAYVHESEPFALRSLLGVSLPDDSKEPRRANDAQAELKRLLEQIDL